MKHLKLIGIISISFSAALFAIGVNESIHYGVAQSYWLFMFSLMGLFAFGLLRRYVEKNPPEAKANADAEAITPATTTASKPTGFKAGPKYTAPKKRR